MMDSNRKKKTLLHISNRKELILLLIQKELHDHRIKSDFENIGFETSEVFKLDLGLVILTLIEIEERSDEIWNWYEQIIDWHSAQIIPTRQDSYQSESRTIYSKLMSRVK